jgi:tetratricopeptide (TPR) repeat protein
VRKLCYLSKVGGLLVFLVAIRLSATDVWSSPAFTIDGGALRLVADEVKPEKHSEATLLLNDFNFNFDPSGKMVETRHLIYRVENQEGVKDWAEISGRWEAWHQDKPDIKARVITSEGAVHWLDLKTLSDFPVHRDAPDVYSDERRYGGPLPAVAPGAIVEEQVVIRDTASLFSVGTTYRWAFDWTVPSHKTQVIISHPESLSLRYQVHLLPDATITKSSNGGVETITLEQGPLPAYKEEIEHVPSDVVLYPEIEFSTGTSWSQVSGEYARISDDKLRPADVQPLLTKINLKDASRQQIVQRIVSLLHQNVRYTGVEFGESSLIPQPPSETLKRKYGDCKDKAALLVTMLRSAGIPANLALLDSGPGRDINTDLPGIGVFDHAIVYIPATASSPELWIDATADYSQVGSLPWMDYGRWALVIGNQADPLKRIPELTASQNLYRETRDFTLAEYGMATISETDEEIGPGDADYRRYYDEESKEVRDSAESYVKDTYLAESLISLEHGDLSDLQKSGSVRFVAKGKRGSTDLNTALAFIRVENLFNRLPSYFTTKEDPPAAASDDSEKPAPRTVDWWINPFTAEWRYKVTAPLGFKLRALPSDKSEKIASLTFTQNYSSNPEGTVVEAVLRLENPNLRMTVQQAKDLRDEVVKARSADPISISFDNVGHSLISAGKIKEGLAAYRQIAAQHPQEALHKVQLSQTLLSVGLGEEARAVAREATILEPRSGLAFSTLGMVLKHDLIGRQIKKGMDYDGAVVAYRKAIVLDPKDKESRANLALLFEYDANGTRYSANARLKDAVDVLRDLKKIDEDYGRGYDDNVIYDLWYAHDFRGVLEYATPLPSSDSRRGLILAAIAIQQGTDAALKKSLEMTTDDQERSKALTNAGALLVRVRKYAEGATMMAEGARGQNNESQAVRSADLFSKTRPYQEGRFEKTDPREPVQRLFGEMLSGVLTIDQFRSLIYNDAMDPNEMLEQKQFDSIMSTLKSQLEGSGLPLVTVADLAVSNMHYTVDGNDALGYKITIESPGAAAQDSYVVLDEGQRYKVAAFSEGGSSFEELAPLVLKALDKSDLVAARKWLDRARDKIHVSGGDDPLAGNLFPFFWTKGQEADSETMRTAALVLLRPKFLKGVYLTQLDRARQSAKSEIDRSRLTMVMAYAYSAQQRWNEMLPTAEELIKSYPSSVRAFGIATTAYSGLKKFEEWNSSVQVRISQFPDELEYVRSSARLSIYRGQYAQSREITKTIIDKGQATSNDLNLYAWYALFLPTPVAHDGIEIGQRANELTKNTNFGILHTVACLDAQAGLTSQARELLLKAMEASHLEEPNSEVWFGLGLIAEQYGVVDAAEKMYGRVEKPSTDYPGSSYTLAQLHLATLRDTAKTSIARVRP